MKKRLDLLLVSSMSAWCLYSSLSNGPVQWLQGKGCSAVVHRGHTAWAVLGFLLWLRKVLISVLCLSELFTQAVLSTVLQVNKSWHVLMVIGSAAPSVSFLFTDLVFSLRHLYFLAYLLFICHLSVFSVKWQVDWPSSLILSISYWIAVVKTLPSNPRYSFASHPIRHSMDNFCPSPLAVTAYLYHKG